MSTSTHDIGHYRPAVVLLDRGSIIPETVAYGSAAHPERGGKGLSVRLFPSARDTQTITIHENIHTTRTVRTR